MTRLELALKMCNSSRPPVWFMRQAGRYHSHYQNLRKKYSFSFICKTPSLACEATMGPILDFGFDAAILFSDILFPLEAMGMELSFEDKPVFKKKIELLSDVKSLKEGINLVEKLAFQFRAIELIRKELSPDKSLIGFVGGPLTLYCYAVEGTHQNSLHSAQLGFEDGRYDGFLEKVSELLIGNMVAQIRAGANVMAVLDTCAGNFDSSLYQRKIVPGLKKILDKLKESFSDVPIIYYTKGTGPEHWNAMRELPISCLGIDWKNNLRDVLLQWGGRWSIQGNINPSLLCVEDTSILRENLSSYFGSIQSLPLDFRKSWVCGLGHGILPQTPEANVRLFLKLQKEFFQEES